MFDLNGERLSGYVSVVLNGRFLDLISGMETAIRNGDSLLLLPVIEGG
jgi:molybdopterin converting factor small subunit